MNLTIARLFLPMLTCLAFVGFSGISIDPDEQQCIVLERMRLKVEYARFVAFHAGSPAMNPPPQKDVESIIALASQMALSTQK